MHCVRLRGVGYLKRRWNRKSKAQWINVGASVINSGQMAVVSDPRAKNDRRCWLELIRLAITLWRIRTNIFIKTYLINALLRRYAVYTTY